jgi:CHAD domain-containing protein
MRKLLKTHILKNKQQKNIILNELSNEFTIIKEPPLNESRLYYDTFDWRLFRGESYLYRLENRYVLCNSKTDRVINSIHSSKIVDHLFAADFSRSSFRNRLEDLIGIRALLPLFHEKLEAQTVNLLNDDEKIVVRLFFIHSNLMVDQNKILIDPFLMVEAIRGYRNEEKKVHERIQNQSLVETGHSKFQQIIGYSGKKALAYSSKIKIKLQKEMTVGEAVRKILTQYVKVIKQNEAGIRKDIDIEFLHDFRVAIRRTRSLLSQIKNILTIKELSEFRKKLEEVQKLTNVLRDLDVYLLKESYFKMILPLKMRKSLNPLFTEIQKAREEEHEQVIQLLESREYRHLINQWSDFLKSDQLLQTKKSERPVLPYAKKIISKRLKIVLQNGSILLRGNPDDQSLHALRIDCKKLRYLLEFFISLFPAETIKEVVNHLKNLQDLLGEYNDLVIQSSDLQQRLSSLKLQDKELRDTSAALGGLLTIFHQEQSNLKKRFKVTFRQFSHTKQLDIYHHLFN